MDFVFGHNLNLIPIQVIQITIIGTPQNTNPIDIREYSPLYFLVSLKRKKRHHKQIPSVKYWRPYIHIYILTPRKI